MISRFRVANQLSESVAQAFRERPHLVENAKGFVGIEILRDAADPNIFYLFTRWDDFASYQSWHSSPAHIESHRGIPKGLKLDPAYTKIEILNDDDTRERDRQGMSEFLSGSPHVYQIHLDQSATIRSCSPALCAAMGLVSQSVVGNDISDFLVESDVLPFRERLKSGASKEEFILNFAPSNLTPISVRARLFADQRGTILVAEKDTAEETDINTKFVDLNNELALLTRDIQQKNRDLKKARDTLAKALEERDKSFWYIRKLQEVLPFCMGCKKVKSADESSWESLEKFLIANTEFLSHGYCPECLEKWKRDNL